MARLFNGSSDVLSSSAPPVSAYPITVAYWGRVSTTSGTQVAIVGSNDGGDPNSNQFFAAYLNGATASSYSTPSNASAGTVSTNTWFHHAAVLASSTSNTCYLNGSAGSTVTTSITATAPTDVYVGQGATGATLPWNGDIAEVAIWNVALTAAEIASLAAGISPVLIRPQSLVSYNPLVGRYSPEIDLRGTMPLTLSGTSASDHPRVFKPGPPLIAPYTAAGGDITLNADQGTITVTGYAATATFSVAAAQGTVSVSGQAATVGLGMAAAQGSLSVSGQASTVGFLTAAAQGSLTVAGQDATVSWQMAGAQGAVTITGYDATFDVPGDIAMDADTGTLTVAGQDATVSWSVALEQGSISVSGQAASIMLGMNVDLGSMTLVGYAAEFDGAEEVAAPVEEPIVGGGRIVAGTFTRKKWRALADAKRARQEAEDQARSLKAKRRRAIEEAAEKAGEAIAAAEQAGAEEETALRLEQMAEALDAARNAIVLADVIREANEAVMLANAVMRAIEDEREEEAVVSLLLL